MPYSEPFALQIGETRRRLAAILERGGAAESVSAAEEVVQDLQVTLEELQVADEELRQQTEELDRSRGDLEASQKRYMDLFEHAPAAYFVTDRHGTIRECNRLAELLIGKPREFLRGKPLALYIAPSVRGEMRERLSECGTRRAAAWESLAAPSGEKPVVPVSVSVRVLPAPDDCPHGFEGSTLLWVMQDLSATKGLQERVRQLDRDLWLRVAERTAALASENTALKDEVRRLRPGGGSAV